MYILCLTAACEQYTPLHRGLRTVQVSELVSQGQSTGKTRTRGFHLTAFGADGPVETAIALHGHALN